MDLEFTKDDCFMHMHKYQACSGDISPSLCGFSCPFRKTMEEQTEIEKRIVERFVDIGYVGTYRSCIDNRVLYKSNGRKTETYI